MLKIAFGPRSSLLVLNIAGLCWVAILLLLSSSVGHADLSVVELVAVHEQSMSAIGRLSAKTHFEGKLSGTDEAIRLALKQSEDMIALLRTDIKLEKAIRDEAVSHGEKVGGGTSGVVSFIKEKTAKQVEAEKKRRAVRSDHMFVVGEIREVQQFLNAKELGSGGIASKRTLQYGLVHDELGEDSRNRWTCLEPTKIQGKTAVWCKTIVRLSGIVPIGFEHPALVGELDTGFAEFWSDAAKLNSFGTILISGRSCHLIGHSTSKDSLLLGAFDTSSISCVPIWIVELGKLPKGEAAESSMEEVAQSVEALSNGTAASLAEGSFCPKKAVYFSDRTQLPRFGLYPKKIRIVLPMVAKLQNGRHEIARLHEYELVVKELKFGNDVQTSAPIKIEKGFTYHDRDTDRSWLIGAEPPFSAVASKRNWTLLFLTILCSLIGLLLVIRRKRGLTGIRIMVVMMVVLQSNKVFAENRGN